MTGREQVIAGGLGAFIALGVLGGGAYFLVLGPLGDKAAQEQKLRTENDDKDLELAKIRKELPRLQVAVRRSLGADVNTAALEYNAAIRRVLDEAKMPPGSTRTVTPLLADSKSAPELPAPAAAPTFKRPAYTRVGLDVTLRKVDLATVVNVLKGYYRLNLLHQITKFKVTRDDAAAAGRPAADGSRTAADRPDLDVSFTTVALSVAGAEARRSLLPVSPAFGGALGAVAGYQLTQSEEITRGLTPLQLAQILAPNDRDYSLLLAKDIFHGPPPPPAPPPVPVKQPEKDDTSEFIHLTGIGPERDGARTATIIDRASNQDYLVEVTRKGGVLVASVTKSTHTPKGERKSLPPGPDLDISDVTDNTSSTAMRFRVIGLLDDGLVLALKEGAAPKPAPAPRAPGGPKRPGGMPGRPITADAAPVADERVYLWPFSAPLSRIKELTGADKDEMVKRATAGE